MGHLVGGSLGVVPRVVQRCDAYWATAPVACVALFHRLRVCLDAAVPLQHRGPAPEASEEEERETMGGARHDGRESKAQEDREWKKRERGWEREEGSESRVRRGARANGPKPGDKTRKR